MGSDIHYMVWVPKEYNGREYHSPLRPVFSRYGRTINLDNLFTYPEPLKKFFHGRDWDYENPLGSYIKVLEELQADPMFTEANDAANGFDARNYDFFSIIGDVRNGFGFAGVHTGSWIPPIGSNRDWAELPFADDLPKKNSEGFYDYDEEGFWYGDHSWSWVTIQELIDYPWDSGRQRGGVIPLWNNEKEKKEAWLTKEDIEKGNIHFSYEELRGTRKQPATWSGSIMGPGIVTISEEDANKILDDTNLERQYEQRKIRYYVQYEWDLTYRESVNLNVFKSIEWFAKYFDPKNTYLVFGFDS